LWLLGVLLVANVALSVRTAYWRRRLYQAVKASQVALEHSLGTSASGGNGE
jgi:hypothetical protein